MVARQELMPRLGCRGAGRCPASLVSMLLKEDVAMRTYDLEPLWRSTVGYDHLMDLIDGSARWPAGDNYPPYNIERTDEDHYQVALAVAGFTPEEITITAEQNVLTNGRAERAHR
jgi:HSP20 family molecular chaperone IbpA